jgi:hypothetical protein
MTNFKVSDEVIDFQISRAVVVRVQDWKNNYLVGDSKGTIVALIPYQSEDGKQNALKIARQIVSANIDFTLDYDYDA